MPGRLNIDEGHARVDTSCHRVSVIGSTTPARRKADQAWQDTQPDPGSQVFKDDQAQDRFAEWLFTVVAVGGVLILLSFLWWAGKGGRWVAPW